MSNPLVQSTGRRKEAVARVRLRPGSGIITVNGRSFEQYFPILTHRVVAIEPLRLTQTADVYDVDATLDGGGVSGQAGALRLGIARALVTLDDEARPQLEEGRPAHARRAREGAAQVRPEEGPQGTAVLEALSGVASRRMTLRFGTDGVRGVANSELTVELVTALGRADRPRARRRAAVRRRARHAALRPDARSRAGRRNLRGRRRRHPHRRAAHTRDRVPRPRTGAPAAVISASHNSYEDNGVKLFSAGGPQDSRAARGRRRARARRPGRVDARRGSRAVSASGVASEHRGALDDYVAHLVESLEGRRLDGMRIVVDCGNGAAFRAAPAALRALGADVDVLHAAPDGTNINDECGSTHPEELRDAVIAVGRADRSGLRRRRRPRDRGRREGRARRRRPDARDRRHRPPRPRAAARRRGRRHGDVQLRAQAGTRSATASSWCAPRSATATCSTSWSGATSCSAASSRATSSTCSTRRPATGRSPGSSSLDAMARRKRPLSELAGGDDPRSAGAPQRADVPIRSALERRPGRSGAACEDVDARARRGRPGARPAVGHRARRSGDGGDPPISEEAEAAADRLVALIEHVARAASGSSGP